MTEMLSSASSWPIAAQYSFVVDYYTDHGG